MAQSGGFDVSKLSMPTKLLLGGGVLYLINLFLPWQRLCVDFGLGESCGTSSGLHGIGILNLLLVLALLAWEVMAFTSMQIQAPRALVSAGLAAGILVFTLLKILTDNDFIYIFAWVGLVLALVITYGGWSRWQEHQAGAAAGGSATPPAPPGPDGFSS